MTIIFFINSKTVCIEDYNIKDVLGSSGRLDVISRCILAAILNIDGFDKNTQIWAFLDKYGTFIFNPEVLNIQTFPKNELLFTDYFVKFMQKYNTNEELTANPLKAIKVSQMSIIDALIHFRELKYRLYIMYEQGKNFFEQLSNIKLKENIVFIIGSQEDEFIGSKELAALNLTTLSMGEQSYLASSIIRLLKLHLLSL